MYQEITFFYAFCCFIAGLVNAGFIISNLINYVNMNITLLEVLASGIFGLLQVVTLGLIVYIWQTGVKRTDQNGEDIRSLQIDVGEVKYNYLDRFKDVGDSIGGVHTEVAAVKVQVSNLSKSVEYIITKIDSKTTETKRKD